MKTRFCPSPTGRIHLGNARTAFFSALWGKSQQGDFLLRIEDTDQTRSYAEYAKKLMHDLKWLGVEWQEGPQVEGPNSPYWQSQRSDIYAKYYDQLIAQNMAYPCFCSEEQLALNRKVQRAAGQPPRYPGTCRNLSADEAKAKIAAGGRPTLRFRVPANHEIVFNDAVKGKQVFKSNDIGDFIIRRADGTSSFMFCNAIDDAIMGVTHVLRGDDHLTNSPRQIMILEALGLPIPHYAHMALILGDDGSPLSKRNGSRSVEELREQGYLAIALQNYLARLGHQYEQNELMTFEQLAAKFDVNKFAKSASRFDLEHLNYWQKEAALTLEPENFWEWIPDHAKQLVPEDKKADFIATVQPNVMFPDNAVLWAKAIFSEHIDYEHAGLEFIKAAGVGFFETAIHILDEKGLDFKSLSQELKARRDVKGKQLFMPLRVALTGETFGPELANVLPLMGMDLAKQRFEAALYKI